MGPPTDVSPQELWAKLSEQRPAEVIDFPRKDFKGKPIARVRIQVLTMADHNTARMRGHAELKKSAASVFGLGKLDPQDMQSPAVNEVLGDLIAHEVLCLACTKATPEPGTEHDRPFYTQLFKDAEQLRNSLTADEVAILFNAYMLTQAKYGPFERSVTTTEDGNAWVKRLAEGADAYPLLHLSLPQLAELTLWSLGRLFSLSRILESQRSNLPPTLTSSLESYFLGTSTSGEQLDTSTETSTGRLVDEVTLELARSMAERQKAEREEP